MSEVLKRESVSENRKWKLEDILSEDGIEKMFDYVQKAGDTLASFAGKLNKDNALECLLTMSRTGLIIEKLYVYCNMRWDEDKSNTKYAELCSRVEMLLTDYSSKTSFIAPSFSAMKKSVLLDMKKDPKFEYYTMFLDEIIRKKKHLLSEKEENILAKSSLFADQFKTVFSVFDNVNVPFGEVEYEGNRVKLSHGLYSVLLQNEERNVRKDAYEAMYKGYKSMIDTVAGVYIGSVKSDCFYADVRKYRSSLDQALFSDNVPEKVYNKLIEVVRKNTGLLHKYMEYRRKTLKVDKLSMYDLFVPIVQGVDTVTGYDEAFNIVCEALSPLGKDYTDRLKEAKTSGWIDVEETENKRSGAYSWGVYGTHPYVLLNHKGTIHDVFTIAHELGHAMHTFYSNSAQCYEKAGYSIFVAEIASTVNEVLLIKYLLKDAKGAERKYLLSYFIDMIRTTLFRQTMFSEFEKYSHETIEKGEPLSYKKMCDYYADLNRFYYGDSVDTDENISYEWARIPHFYNAFYVYKYATGITCAVNIAKMILEDPKKVDEYKAFLSAGGSEYPLEIIKKVGIDLTSNQPYSVVMKEFSTALKDLISIK